jgi:hypothetical protein
MIARFAVAVLVTVLATVSGFAESWRKLPNHKLTPGAINESLSLTKICSTKWVRMLGPSLPR